MKKVRSNDRKESVPSASMTPTPGIGTYTSPVAFFIALAVLAYLGHAELGYHHGEFSAAVYEPYQDARSIPKVGGASPVDAGRDIYAQMCLACHQPNGSGNPANGCPPLAGSDWVLEDGAARIIRIVLGGAKGPIKVSGKEWGSATGMLAFKDSLNDDQIAAVLTYIRQSPEWKNSASEVTPEMVKAIREKTASRALPWTADELLKLPVTE